MAWGGPTCFVAPCPPLVSEHCGQCRKMLPPPIALPQPRLACTPSPIPNWGHQFPAATYDSQPPQHVGELSGLVQQVGLLGGEVRQLSGAVHEISGRLACPAGAAGTATLPAGLQQHDLPWGSGWLPHGQGVPLALEQPSAGQAQHSVQWPGAPSCSEQVAQALLRTAPSDRRPLPGTIRHGQMAKTSVGENRNAPVVEAAVVAAVQREPHVAPGFCQQRAPVVPSREEVHSSVKTAEVTHDEAPTPPWVHAPELSDIWTQSAAGWDAAITDARSEAQREVKIKDQERLHSVSLEAEKLVLLSMGRASNEAWSEESGRAGWEPSFAASRSAQSADLSPAIEHRSSDTSTKTRIVRKRRVRSARAKPPPAPTQAELQPRSGAELVPRSPQGAARLSRASVASDYCPGSEASSTKPAIPTRLPSRSPSCSFTSDPAGVTVEELALPEARDMQTQGRVPSAAVHSPSQGLGKPGTISATRPLELPRDQHLTMHTFGSVAATSPSILGQGSTGGGEVTLASGLEVSSRASSPGSVARSLWMRSRLNEDPERRELKPEGDFSFTKNRQVLRENQPVPSEGGLAGDANSQQPRKLGGRTRNRYKAPQNEDVDAAGIADAAQRPGAGAIPFQQPAAETSLVSQPVRRGRRRPEHKRPSLDKADNTENNALKTADARVELPPPPQQLHSADAGERVPLVEINSKLSSGRLPPSRRQFAVDDSLVQQVPESAAPRPPMRPPASYSAGHCSEHSAPVTRLDLTALRAAPQGSLHQSSKAPLSTSSKAGSPDVLEQGFLLGPEGSVMSGPMSGRSLRLDGATACRGFTPDMCPRGQACPQPGTRSSASHARGLDVHNREGGSHEHTASHHRHPSGYEITYDLQGPHSSIDRMASERSIPSSRRDSRGVHSEHHSRHSRSSHGHSRRHSDGGRHSSRRHSSRSHRSESARHVPDHYSEHKGHRSHHHHSSSRRHSARDSHRSSRSSKMHVEEGSIRDLHHERGSERRSTRHSRSSLKQSADYTDSYLTSYLNTSRSDDLLGRTPEDVSRLEAVAQAGRVRMQARSHADAPAVPDVHTAAEPPQSYAQQRSIGGQATGDVARRSTSSLRADRKDSLPPAPPPAALVQNYRQRRQNLLAAAPGAAVDRTAAAAPLTQPSAVEAKPQPVSTAAAPQFATEEVWYDDDEASSAEDAEEGYDEDEQEEEEEEDEEEDVSEDELEDEDDSFEMAHGHARH
mmetsp:Transcript_3712/g.9456  ORF Transcript_3712/g.9456 Transcript_3712/m.9456 type:complete len:1222 (+) Transcript_3712:98-3763(+)